MEHVGMILPLIDFAIVFHSNPKGYPNDHPLKNPSGFTQKLPFLLRLKLHLRRLWENHGIGGT